MLKFLPGFVITALLFTSLGCKTTRKINKAIARKDTSSMVFSNTKVSDSIAALKGTRQALHDNMIRFNTFNAKIKVDYEDNKGKQPDITAVIRIIKDSIIWMSLSATFLNFEVYRIYITRDSVILVNKTQKEVQFRSIDYLQDVTNIPFDFKTLQDLLVGNPIFLDSTIISFRKTDKFILLSTAGQFFKNLLTLSIDDYRLLHSKLDDVDVNRNRTADITYDGFDYKNGFPFSTSREIVASEKNKLDIHLNYKIYEFNKELSVPINIPKNYDRK